MRWQAVARPSDYEDHQLRWTCEARTVDYEHGIAGYATWTRDVDAAGAEPSLLELWATRLGPSSPERTPGLDFDIGQLGEVRDGTRQEARRRFALYDAAVLGCERLAARPPGRELPPGWLELVGQVWSGITAAGVSNPLVRMNDLSGVSLPTIRSWVGAARVRGLLEPFEGDGHTLAEMDEWTLGVLNELQDAWVEDPRSIAPAMVRKLQDDIKAHRAKHEKWIAEQQRRLDAKKGTKR